MKRSYRNTPRGQESAEDAALLLAEATLTAHHVVEVYPADGGHARAGVAPGLPKLFLVDDVELHRLQDAPGGDVEVIFTVEPHVEYTEGAP